MEGTLGSLLGLSRQGLESPLAIDCLVKMDIFPPSRRRGKHGARRRTGSDRLSRVLPGCLPN